MKITEIKTILASRMHEPERQWFTSTFLSIKAYGAFVQIGTDEGLTGIGVSPGFAASSQRPFVSARLRGSRDRLRPMGFTWPDRWKTSLKLRRY